VGTLARHSWAGALRPGDDGIFRTELEVAGGDEAALAAGALEDAGIGVVLRAGDTGGDAGGDTGCGPLRLPTYVPANAATDSTATLTKIVFRRPSP
jgi:hypothetical protein